MWREAVDYAHYMGEGPTDERTQVMPSFEDEYGTEEKCPKNPNGPHEADLNYVHVERSGTEHYIDVVCKHCGRGGCVGMLSQLAEQVSW